MEENHFFVRYSNFGAVFCGQTDDFDANKNK
jgi:hypothetical protein